MDTTGDTPGPAFLGSLVIAIVFLVPLLAICYIAVMGRVRLAIKEDLGPVSGKVDVTAQDLLKLELRVADDISTVKRNQEVTQIELNHIRKGVDRLETMIAGLVEIHRKDPD